MMLAACAKNSENGDIVTSFTEEEALYTDMENKILGDYTEASEDENAVDTPEKAVTAYFEEKTESGELSGYEINGIKIEQLTEYSFLNSLYPQLPDENMHAALVEYTLNGDDKENERSEIFILSLEEGSFAVTSILPYEPHSFYGTIKSVYTENDSTFCIIAPDENADEAKYGELFGISCTLYGTASEGEHMLIEYNGSPREIDGKEMLYIACYGMVLNDVG